MDLKGNDAGGAESVNSLIYFGFRSEDIITQTVMVERKRATTVASEKERRGKTRRPGAHHNAVVQTLICHGALNPSSALDQPV